MRPRTRPAIRAAVAALLGMWLAGCSLASSTGATAPAGITQQLLIRSLERALGDIDLARIGGRPVALEVGVQAGNEGFVKDFVTTWLKAHGVRIAGDSPELKLKLFVAVYGTDHDQTLIGIPAFQAPVVNVPVPELAFFKWVRNRGQTELRLWAFDGKGDRLKAQYFVLTVASDNPEKWGDNKIVKQLTIAPPAAK